jgi:hypothetical protein
MVRPDGTSTPAPSRLTTHERTVADVLGAAYWTFVHPDVRTQELSAGAAGISEFGQSEGPYHLNRWLTERRNVYEDYKPSSAKIPRIPQAVVARAGPRSSTLGAKMEHSPGWRVTTFGYPW